MALGNRGQARFGNPGTGKRLVSSYGAATCRVRQGMWVLLAFGMVGCAGLPRGGEATDPRQARYSQPRDVVWEAVRTVLEEQRYEVLEEYRARGVMSTDWQLETREGLVYRSRVEAWVSGTGPYRVELDVQMYVRAVSAPTDVRMEEYERERADQLYRALYARLGG
jgi:hypothetical protein